MATIPFAWRGAFRIFKHIDLRWRQNSALSLAAGETDLVSNWVPASDLSGLDDIAGTHDAPFSGDVVAAAPDPDPSTDTLDGGDGNDTIFGQDGADIITVGVGDTAEGGADADSFTLDFTQTSSDGSTTIDVDGGTDGNDSDTLDLTGLGAFSVSETADADADSTSGTATYDSGQVVNFTEIENLIVCFADGTEIKTEDGVRPIGTLKVGDNVKTRDNGLQTIRWIGKRVLSAKNLLDHPKLRPVCISAGALGENRPSRDLVVSPQHRIVVRSKIAIRMFDAAEVFVPAKHLLGLDGVDVLTHLEGVTFYHLLCDDHETIEADGALVETLHTGSEALKAMTPEALDEITFLFGDGVLSERLMALRALKGRQARALVARHVKNNQVMYR
ncbi:MAG: Hint domain-containing protein [Litoreibacter sp.]